MRKRSQLLLVAVCAITLSLIAVHTSAQEPANAGLAHAAKARRAPATPLEMALRLEKEQAKGAGMLMPDPERQARLSGGIIPLDGRAEGFPAAFLKGLVPDDINGVEAWRATLRTDDVSGDILFYNADGEVFWSVAADAAMWSADWVARIHSPDGKAADFYDTDQVLQTLSEKQARGKVSEEVLYRSAWLATRQYFRPSHVEMAFTFILQGDLDAYRSAGTATQSLASNAMLMSMPMSMSAPLTGLAVTGFTADTNGVALSAAWPTGTSIAGDALDIFFTRTLIPPAWSNLWRVAVDPAAGAVDVAIPRAELPPPPEAPPAACVTNIVPSAYDPGVMVTNIVCTNGVWLTDSGFFRLADLADTDGDGLTDACENWMYGTRSDLIDTDGDTLDDGWEAGHSLDPLSPDGVDGAYGDPDADGLPNIGELRAGTDPHVGDWDGDDVPDGVEAAWWEATVPFPWFDVTGGTVVLQNSSLDDDLRFTALPFPVLIGGAVCTNAALDVNGIAYLLDTLKLPADDISSRYGNEDMKEGWPLTDNHFAVAAHWDDLYARAAAPATRITVADVTTNGARYCVIEYRDMGFYSNSSARVSFQIVIPENGTNTVFVRYADAAGANTGGAATLGAQGPGADINIPVSFNIPFITDGLTLAYHFGSGGSPFVKDTDGDGLEDGAEAALGTSPANADSDGDGLPDKWEADHVLDPLSASGDDGADGDPDGDGLLNRDEFEHGADPQKTDQDEDDLTDLVEVGGVTLADIPWFDLPAGDDITPLFGDMNYSCLTVPLAAPATIRGTVFTNLTLDINGLVYLNPTGYQNNADSQDWHDDMAGSWTVDENALTLAPFWANLIAITNTAPASKILSGTATDGTNLYRVIEYRNMRINAWPVSTNNMVSFQLAIPTGATDRVFVRYALASGTADGQDASIGVQWIGGVQKDSWCFDQPGRVRPGLSLALVIGTGSNPQIKDTDDDGLSDAEEAVLGTDPRKRDTDGDRLPDKWEADHGFNPAVNNDTDGIDDNGAEEDFDGDGLSNFDEYLNGTYPDVEDSDDDGTNDGDEVGQGSDPNDPSDNGQPPPPEDILELPFNIYGDYAAWEMTIEGRGPSDFRVFKLSTDAPGGSATVVKKLKKGNSYRLTMKWLESVEDDVDWYCWRAQIDGLPAQQTYNSYDSTRIPGAAVTVSGNGWFADNADGLLTSHVHMNDDGGGNVAGGLEAILYVPKIVSISVASAKLGASPNPPPFPGQTNHVFRPDRSPETDKHAVVLYKDTVDAGFNVQDFDVTLTAALAPADTPTGGLVFLWEKISGPASGQLLPSSSLSATYRNPKQGGVYRFRLSVRCDGEDVAFGEANLACLSPARRWTAWCRPTSPRPIFSRPVCAANTLGCLESKKKIMKGGFIGGTRGIMSDVRTVRLPRRFGITDRWIR